MQARAPLMIEHRLIEKMLKIVQNEVTRIRASQKVDPVFIDTVVDFIRIYADKTHHGKEEDILFKYLAEKNMPSDQQRIMEELIDEHKLGRKLVSELVEAKQAHFAGDASALNRVVDQFELLIDFYPKHITKEDRIFFPAMMDYLPVSEDQKMLSDFWEFDRQMIHYKYRSLVTHLEKN